MDSGRGLFIDGAWRPRGARGETPVSDPATGDLLGVAPAASGDTAREGGTEGIADDRSVKLARVAMP